MYKAIIGDTSFEIETKGQEIFLDGAPFSWNIVSTQDNHFHIIHDKKSYRAEIVKIDKATRTMTVKVNNHSYSVAVKDKLDLLLEQMGMSKLTTNHISSIKAPMPGLIVDVRIAEGAEVKQNDPLIVLEAMKMENIIKSPVDGTIKSVHVKKGDSVEKNQVLIEF